MEFMDKILINRIWRGRNIGAYIELWQIEEQISILSHFKSHFMANFQQKVE